MGSVDRGTHERIQAASGLSPFCPTDYGDLTQQFIREFNARSHGVPPPHCLFIDIEEGGDALRLISRQGNESHRILRDSCGCFGNASCSSRQKLPRPDGKSGCQVFLAPTPGEDDPEATPYDLVMSCHSISFISNPRAVCFLENLRHRVRPGGMLFISAFGRYSVLGEHYPAAGEPIATRFASLHDNTVFRLAPETRLCLYGERDLCTTLFEAGWSVLRSSTTTENNVLALAIRV